MSRFAISTRHFAAGTSLEDVGTTLRGWGLEHVVLDLPGPVPPAPRVVFRDAGITVFAVAAREGPGASAEDPGAFRRTLGPAAAAVASARAEALVVEGGGLGAHADRALGRADEAWAAAGGRHAPADLDAIREARDASREAAADRAVRTLHAALREGSPLAVRNGGAAEDLLGYEETEWILDALPRLGFFFDPTRALRLERMRLGPAPEAWAERFAARTAAVFLHGLGSDLRGGSHPEDGAPDWRALVDGIPRRATRVLDLDPVLTPEDAADGLRYARLETD